MCYAKLTSNEFITEHVNITLQTVRTVLCLWTRWRTLIEALRYKLEGRGFNS